MKIKIVTISLILLLLFSSYIGVGTNINVKKDKDEGADEITTSNLLGSFSWRSNNGDWTTPLKDQGSCGACWAFATIAVIESIINIKSGNPNLDLDLSEQYLLSGASQDIWIFNCNGCDGASFAPPGLSSFLDWTREHDVVLEDCFPYTANDETTYGGGCDKKFADVTAWGHVDGRDNIKNKLRNHGPLYCVIKVWTDFLGSSTSSVYSPGDGAVPTGDSHAMAIVGYNDDQGYWLCKCSSKPFGHGAWRKIAYGVCGIEDDVVYINVDYNYDPGEDDQEPDLEAEGSFNFGEVPGKTGEKCTKTIKLRNDGGSSLFWEYDADYPDYGRNWLLRNSEGSVIVTGDNIEAGDEQYVTLTFETEKDPNTRFNGDIEFYVHDNPSDYEVVQISGSTPNIKSIFLINLFEKFDFLRFFNLFRMH